MAVSLAEPDGVDVVLCTAVANEGLLAAFRSVSGNEPKHDHGAVTAVLSTVEVEVKVDGTEVASASHYDHQATLGCPQASHSLTPALLSP
eukprot:3937275-Rhodomonas_salina.1